VAFRPFSPFINRKPWAAVVVTFVLAPMGGLFYLGKGALGLLYGAAYFVAAFLAALAAHYGDFDLSLKHCMMLGALTLTVVAAGHCFVVAKKAQGAVPVQWFARWYFLFVLLFAQTVIPHLMRSFLFEPFNIPSGASLPNLKVGDHLFVSKYAYGYSRYSFPVDVPVDEGRWFFTPPKRGDIAVLKLPTDPRVNYIKRIVGLPGDRIQVKGGILHINDRPVDRERVGEYTRQDSLQREPKVTPQFRETLPNGATYFILEETDQALMDNTPVYEVPAGHYFAMGDNRDRTRDSRFLQDVGYIPEENLVGRLALLYWNSETKRLLFLD